ncbi:DUF4303 domain-containing protein [Paenibacillus agilis]|uniref:DUF4303 domain-containing protein n=1 Tax=Paenibacillus agilis TaxID=3020863 RepID=A0A559J0A4_9BACL|nr:DUF4303 domain-containing protein [Paenibacillus agilis]TVX93310.1 DUF4303 domain-containing protein [Paenibacillus agilis]
MLENIDLVKLIRDAAQNCFSELRKSNPADEFCAFGLYSDEGAMTVCPSANTTEYLKKKCEEDPDEPLYYKWSSAEWKYEFSGQEWFNDVQQVIEHFHKSPHNDEQFIHFQEYLYESCVLALEQLRLDGFFQTCIVVFSVTDYLDDEKEISWIYRLNNAREASEFEKSVRQ